MASSGQARAEVERIRSEFQRRGRELSADRYSWIHPVNRYVCAQIWRHSIARLADAGLYPLTGRRVLDVGCGGGSWAVEFVQWGADPADIAGIDVIAERLDEAKRCLPTADIRVGDASRMPWSSDSFDLVTQFTVFTSILDADMRRAIAAEMVRVLKPGGIILWYDFAFNNPGNTNVRGIDEAQIRELFRGCDISVAKLMLAPPIARAVVPRSWILAHMLEKLPFLRTHRMATIRKPSR